MLDFPALEPLGMRASQKGVGPYSSGTLREQCIDHSRVVKCLHRRCHPGPSNSAYHEFEA